MEPNQSATPTNEAAGSSAADQPQNSQQNAGNQQNAGADSSNKSSEQQSSGGAKNWMEQAGIQKIVDQLPQGVREFLPNSWEQINKLSTTQKVAGVVALAGLGYLATRSGKSGKKMKGVSYYGDSAQAQRPNQNYRSGSQVHPSSYSSSNSQVDESRRMDKGPNRGASSSSAYGSSGFDRQNENRVGGSYNSGNSGKSDYSSGFSSGYDSDNKSSDSSSSSMAGRSQGYRGSSSSSDDSDFASGV
ncbi:hypothetical protein [Hymenobacter sp. DG01]|uniref:hypothetical protein n=1 Tax=Hymenobacter sp. DG01 TaxID=2584940 RepID=UPI0011242827|nr:hypothetical protein [Hymenobacter sp. DG01]